MMLKGVGTMEGQYVQCTIMLIQKWYYVIQLHYIYTYAAFFKRFSGTLEANPENPHSMPEPL